MTNSDADTQRVLLTDKLDGKASYLGALRTCEKRTGLGAAALLAGRKDRPRGLNASMVKAWLDESVKSARRDHMEYVLCCWRKALDDPKIPITDEILQTLLAERQRTGLGAIALLKMSNERCPKGLSAGIINHWLARQVNAAHRSHIEFVLALWRSCPTSAQPIKLRKGYTELSAAILDELRAYQARTKIGPTALLRMSPGCPKGLRATNISRWLSGNAKSAPAAHLEFVRKAWANVPSPRHSPNSN